MDNSSSKKIIAHAVHSELIKVGAAAAITQMIVAIGIAGFLKAHIMVNPILLATITSVVVFNIARTILSKLKKIDRGSWMSAFSVISFLNSVSWASFFMQLSRLATNDTSILCFSFIGPMALCSSSFLTMSISKRDSFFFQAPLILGLMSSFFIAFGNTQGSYLATLSTLVYFIYTVRAQKNWYETWSNLQLYNFELQTIMDSNPGGISVIRNGCYIKINSYLKETFNLSEDSLYGQPYGNLYPDSDFTKKLSQFMSSDKTKSEHEFSLPTVKGQRLHYVIFKKFQIEGKGNQVIISSFDIEELEQAHIKLEQQRSKMVSNAKMAALGEVSGGLAHEVNNPLAVISARAQMMIAEIESDTATKEKTLKGVETILSMATRISKIIKALKHFARDSSNDSFEEADLEQIINETIALCDIRSQKCGVPVQQIMINEIKLECLPTQISQVILNALNNSFDAVESLEVKWIKIESFCSGPHVHIEISDSGHGIPQAVQEKIMKPFFTTKKAGSGTGLGLSLSKGIASDHRGQLYFDHTSPNTKIVLILPLKQSLKPALAG